MQLTPNYKLKKLEDTDPVDVQDLNDNADIIDAELKKKAESSGGDISGMTVKTLDTITTEFPVPVAGESTKTFLGKIKKYMTDIKNWMTGVCMLGQLVNNCVTNRADLPLAAAQGKVLMDLYTQLYSDIGNQIIKRPDYTTAESINFPYTAPADGYVCGGIYSLAGSECKILINGYMIGWSYSVASHVGSPLMLPVKTGDIISAIGYDQTRAFFVHTVK